MKKEFGANVEQIAGEGGIFDVTVDGTLVYSKHETGRHIRDNQEIIDLVTEMQDS
jgi:predicted Rdx family selenoprotein